MASAAVTEAVQRTDDPKTAAWWTEADDAELACLVRELVDVIFDHKGQCSRCLAYAAREHGSLPCPRVSQAIGVVVDWRERRGLLSRALWLRRQREQLEYARDLIAFRRTA